MDYQLMACTFYMESLLFLQNSDIIAMQFKLVSVNETTLGSREVAHLCINLHFLCPS